MKKAFLGFYIIILAVTSLLSQQNDFPKLNGPYLGQKPPGMTPEIFAPGIVSTGMSELNSAFSPDGREFYFCVRTSATSSIFRMQLKSGKWSKPDPKTPL